MRAVAGIHRFIVTAMAALAGLSLVAMSLWTSVEVVLRYVFFAPTIWAYDLSEYALLWATFLAAPWVMRENGHVAIEVFVEMLPANGQRIVGSIALLVAAAICCAFVAATADTVIDFFRRGLYFAKPWSVPQWSVYAIIPIGSAFLATELVLAALRTWRHGYRSGGGVA